MASDPTQNYDDPSLVGWRPRPGLARALRVALALLPAAVAAGFGLLAMRLLPPDRVGLAPLAWLAIEIAVVAVLLVAVGRLARRLLPLTALLRLSLVLPDQVPSRFAAIRRRSSPATLLARVEADDADATVLLELVDALNRHDRATFRHCERVQAYATLIGRELGLGPADAARLGWAAMLHDVGKLTIPLELLNKPGRPDEAEWHDLAGHAAAGGALVAPLARWLGPWACVIDQHHERWDGAGYPHGLAGEQISLGARIVAVADAFDVITSARAYKAPLSPDAARAELARCAGTQFDERVVRAFLAVGLGELRVVAGPLALLGTLPVLPPLWSGVARPLARASGTGASVAAAGPSVATAMVVGAGLALASPVLADQAAPSGTEAPDREAGDGNDRPSPLAAEDDTGTGAPADTEDAATTDSSGVGAPAAQGAAAPLDPGAAPDQDDPGSEGTDRASDPGSDPTTDAGSGGATDTADGDGPGPADGTADEHGTDEPSGTDPATGSTDPGEGGSGTGGSGRSGSLPPSASDSARDATGKTQQDPQEQAQAQAQQAQD